MKGKTDIIFWFIYQKNAMPSFKKKSAYVYITYYFKTTITISCNKQFTKTFNNLIISKTVSHMHGRVYEITTRGTKEAINLSKNISQAYAFVSSTPLSHA